MLNKNLEKALNAQINAELWSSYFYLSMSIHFAQSGLMGFSNWFKVQASEENEHAMKFVNYIISRGGKVALQPLEKVTQTWVSPLAAFEDALEHEKEVTQMIHNLMILSESLKDFATISLLQWYVDEQVEEEDNAQKYINALILIQDNHIGIYLLDKDLGARKD